MRRWLVLACASRGSNFELLHCRELLYLRECSSNAHKISQRSYVINGDLRPVSLSLSDSSARAYRWRLSQQLCSGMLVGRI